MSDLLQIFTGNPMSTFLGKKIEAATRPELESEDWALNMEICDIINENDDDAKDAARAIRKRLQQIEQDRNFTITNRTLTVLETCVNNCSHRFHILVMTKDFIQDLVKLIGPKNNPPIDLQERVLSLIENWADAFRNQPDLGGVVSVYNDLKAKGVTFPPRDPNSRVPIQTPHRTVPAQLPPNQSHTSRIDRQARPMSVGPPVVNSAGQVMLEGEGYAKISQDLVVVQSSIEMLDDVIRVLETPNSGEAEWKLADELSATCHQMKDRIVDLIERIANEDLTVELLRLNDELNTTFTRYESLIKGRSQQPDTAAQSTTQPAAGGNLSAESKKSETHASHRDDHSQPSNLTAGSSASRPTERTKLSGVSSSTLNELSLIDFNATRVSGDQTAASKAESKQQQVSKAPVTDPFDTSNLNVSVKPQQSLADELQELDLSGKGSGRAETQVGQTKTTATATAATAQSLAKNANMPEEISLVREQDFAEIENWLSTDSGRDLASIRADMPSMEPISVPNSEFDNFIASRALAGSNTSSQSQSKATQQQKPEPSV